MPCISIHAHLYTLCSSDKFLNVGLQVYGIIDTFGLFCTCCPLLSGAGVLMCNAHPRLPPSRHNDVLNFYYAQKTQRMTSRKLEAIEIRALVDSCGAQRWIPTSAMPYLDLDSILPKQPMVAPISAVLRFGPRLTTHSHRSFGGSLLMNIQWKLSHWELPGQFTL